MTLSFRDELGQMLKINQHFSKHCSCNFQSEYVMAGHFCKSYIRQAVGSELDLVVLTGRAEEQAAIKLEISLWLWKRGDKKSLSCGPLFCSTNQHHLIQLVTYCLPYVRLPKNAQLLHTRLEDGNCNVCRNTR
jgi:hypothetical protein